jgi:CRISPR-associated protein Csd1
MTILQALDRYYDRMAARGEAEAPGYSREPIGVVLTLSPSGELLDVATWLDARTNKPKIETVPKWFGKSGTGSTPFFLWENMAYALGVSSKDAAKTTKDHESFKVLHFRQLAGELDPGLASLRRFLERWTPERFVAPHFEPRMMVWNVAFRLEGDPNLIHERSAAAAHIQSLQQPSVPELQGFCLITGKHGPIVRLHPKIKGVDGTASSEVPLVSFEGDAFKSYGKDQGYNAPTSKAAAFRYAAALKGLLDRNRSRTRLKIGDATVVFWADASGVSELAAAAAEDIFAVLINPPAAEVDPEKLGDDASEVAKVRDFLERVLAGRPLREADSRLKDGVRFHILGLSPNAARLSVRFWLDGSFEVFARRLSEHYADLAIEPAPWRASLPAVNRLLVKTTAMQEKFDNIPPLLAGEMMRAVLTGGLYPRTLLSAAIMRLRAGDELTGWHAAAIRAVLVRHQRRKRISADIPGSGETPVSLDREHPNIGYQLGRLFAVYELAQRSALGRGVKSTIRDKYFGAASATPASIFPVIISNGQNHLSKVRKDKPGWAHVLERELEEVVGRITPARPFSLPRSMPLEDQGEFAIGYYHQRAARLGNNQADRFADEDTEEGEDNA